MAAYFSKSEICKDISSERNSGGETLQNTIFLPVSNALILFGGADYLADDNADSDCNYYFFLGELLDPVFKDEPLPTL